DTNVINGKPIYFWKNRDNGTVPADAGQIILANCSNVIIQHQNISSVTAGIELGFSSMNIIINNTITSNVWHGLYLESSNKNSIIYNTFSRNNKNGILLDLSPENSISYNVINLNAENGIYQYFSSNNTVLNNTVSHNNDGLRFEYSNDNEIIRNSISWNKNSGIYLGPESKRNRIYHNNFFDNSNQATDYGINDWYLDYPNGGNYWSDYLGKDNFTGPKQNITGVDGIGDIAYDLIITWLDVIDLYPLMEPVQEKIQVPTAPLNVEAEPGDGFVLLIWSVPFSDGGATISSYNIYRGNGTINKTLIATVSVTHYNDTEVTNNVTYYYEISAENAGGEGPKSAEVTAIPITTIKPENGDDGDGMIFLYIGILIILVWVTTILITFLMMRKRARKMRKGSEKQDRKKSTIKKRNR
ncbi:NosD domain-containing protein, partial [[Eubacterium] cellulosolvens]